MSRLRHQRGYECNGRSATTANEVPSPPTRETAQDRSLEMFMRKNNLQRLAEVKKAEYEADKSGYFGQYLELTARTMFEAGMAPVYDLLNHQGRDEAPHSFGTLGRNCLLISPPPD
mgnify:CR=1 FL=1